MGLGTKWLQCGCGVSQEAQREAGLVPSNPASIAEPDTKAHPGVGQEGPGGSEDSSDPQSCREV